MDTRPLKHGDGSRYPLADACENHSGALSPVRVVDFAPPIRGDCLGQLRCSISRLHRGRADSMETLPSLERDVSTGPERPTCIPCLSVASSPKLCVLVADMQLPTSGNSSDAVRDTERESAIRSGRYQDNWNR